MKIKLVFLSLLLFTVLVFILYYPRCQGEIVQQTIRGSSLAPLIADGQPAELIKSYYQCHSVNRADIVEFSQGNRTVAKIIKALPGDTVSFSGSVEQGWNIIVNGEVLKNSQGVSYLFSDKRKQLLSLYLNDYQGRIPPQSYVVLGDMPQGTFDSTQFGLLSSDAIVGKIIYDHTQH